MRPSHRRLQKGRVLRLEAIEPRLFLSASPIADFSVDDLAVSNAAYGLAGTANPGSMIGLDQVVAEYGFTGSGQTVALIDTGIAYDHMALGGGYGEGHRVVGGYDFAENDSNPYDDGSMGSHGTHVAGILSSTDARAPGVAPGADVVSLRVFNDQGLGQFSWVEQALQWVHTNRNSFANPITTVNLSLGTMSNTDTVPTWAILEEEFAQLEADGIFISIAAGNSFATYHTVGLSYPAVSSHVVPVASIDASGSLSYFSQRDSRVIAAPGRAILSTVPDYVGNHNGVADDFACYSGTSMAAPFVAGASILLRQAYELAGVANVNEQMLYSTMIATADTVYDPITGANYYRLNLDRAIDSVIPADDFGSTAAAANSLGTLADKLSVDGAIGRIGDHDWFSFTANASGTVTLTAGGSGELNAQWEFASAPADLVRKGSSVTFTVAAGQTYVFGLSTGEELGRYTLDLRLDPTPAATNLISRVGKEIRVSGTAGNDTYALSIAGTYRLTVNGVEYQFDRRAVSSFVFNGNSGCDTIVVQAGPGGATAALQPGVLDLNGLGYKIHATNMENATVRAGSGSNRVALYDSAGNDTLVATPTYAELSGSGFVNRAEGFSSVSAFASGGFDVAQLYDSVGNDTLIASPSDTTLSGRGFSNRARFFDEVNANSVAGGYDTSVVYGSTGNTQLSAIGKKAEVSFGRSSTGGASGQYSSTDGASLQRSAVDGTSARTAKVSLSGFKCVRAMPNGGKVTRSQLAAIDFVLEVIDLRT